MRSCKKQDALRQAKTEKPSGVEYPSFSMVPETGDGHIGEDLIAQSLSRLGDFPTIASGPQRVLLQRERML